MIQSKLLRLPAKLPKNLVIILVGLIIIVFTSVFAYSQRSVSPPPPPPSLPNASPSASLLIPFEVIGYSPKDLNPSIANTYSAIYFEFNRPLTNSEIANFQLTSKPEVSFKKISHINRQILYFTPVNLWKNEILYTLTLSFPQSPDLKTIYITPSSYINQGDVQTEPEDNLPKP